MIEPVRILVLEDADLHFDFLGSFSPSAYDVLFAEDPEEARERCDGESVRLVVIAVERIDEYRALLGELKQAGARLLAVAEGAELPAGSIVDGTVEPGTVEGALAAAKQLLEAAPAVSSKSEAAPAASSKSEATPAVETKAGRRSRESGRLKPSSSYLSRLRPATPRGSPATPKRGPLPVSAQPSLSGLEEELSRLQARQREQAERLGEALTKLGEERARREKLETLVAEQAQLLESVRAMAAGARPEPAAEPPRPLRRTRRGFGFPGTGDIPTVVTADKQRQREPDTAEYDLADGSAAITSSDVPTVDVASPGGLSPLSSDTETSEEHSEDDNTVVERIGGAQVVRPPGDVIAPLPALDHEHTAADAEESSALTAPGVLPSRDPSPSRRPQTEETLASPAREQAPAEQVVAPPFDGVQAAGAPSVEDPGAVLAAALAPPVDATPSVAPRAMVGVEPVRRSAVWLYLAVGVLALLIVLVILLLAFWKTDESTQAPALSVATPAEDAGVAPDSAAESSPDAASAMDPPDPDAAATPAAAQAPPADAAPATPDLSTRELARRRLWARRVQRKGMLREARRLISKGQHKKARAELTKALKMRDDHDVRRLFAESHQRAGELWPAVHHLTKAIAQAPRRAPLEERLATLYFRLGKKAKACAALKRAAGQSLRARTRLAQRCK